MYGICGFIRNTVFTNIFGQSRPVVCPGITTIQYNCSSIIHCFPIICLLQLNSYLCRSVSVICSVFRIPVFLNSFTDHLRCMTVCDVECLVVRCGYCLLVFVNLSLFKQVGLRIKDTFLYRIGDLLSIFILRQTAPCV